MIKFANQLSREEEESEIRHLILQVKAVDPESADHLTSEMRSVSVEDRHVDVRGKLAQIRSKAEVVLAKVADA
jgi:hypothetical protein